MTKLQRDYWQRTLRRTTVKKSLSQRAEILLKHDAGTPKKQIAREVGVDVRTVRKWIKRWESLAGELAAIEAELDNAENRPAAVRAYEQRLADALADDPRCGAPPQFSAEAVAQVIALACENLDESDEAVSRRTQSEIAKEAAARNIVTDISQPTICRILKNSGNKTP